MLIYDQKSAEHAEMQDFTWAAICNMVCHGQCVGVRFAFWLISSCSQTPCPLHLPVSLECCELLFSIYTVCAAVLLRAAAKYSPRIQHEHRFPQPRSNWRTAFQSTKLEIQGCWQHFGAWKFSQKPRISSMSYSLFIGIYSFIQFFLHDSIIEVVIIDLRSHMWPHNGSTWFSVW